MCAKNVERNVLLGKKTAKPFDTDLMKGLKESNNRVKIVLSFNDACVKVNGPNESFSKP